MSSYDFILDGIRFSYSSTSTFENCAYSYKLSYIDAVPRINNFYGEFGSFIHECFENYFTDKLEMFELSQYYRSNYDNKVVTPAPPIPPGLGEKYRIQGQEFFDFFYFDKENYDVLLVEDKIDFDLINGMKFVAKPDLVLQDKETKKYILYDYKTSTPYRIDKRTGKEVVDTKKIDGYIKQMYLYAYALRTYRNIPIEEIVLWYPRLDRKEVYTWSYQKETETLDWLYKVLSKIKTEESFDYDNSSSYFCENLCGVRMFCEYR